MYSALIFLIFLANALGEGNFSVQVNPRITAFRSVGVVVDGVAHAHLAMTFNLTQEHAVVYELKEEIQAVTRNTSTKLWAPTLHRIAPLEENWQDLLVLLHSKTRRERRQAVLAGLAAGAVIVSAGLGVWNAHETKILSERLSKTDADLDNLFKVVHSSVKLERKIISQVSVLKRSMSEIGNELEDLEQFMLVSDAAHALFHRLQRRLHGFERLLANKFDPELIDEAELRQYYAELVESIDKEGFELIYPGVNALFQDDISYVLKGDLLTMFIHVPVVAKHSHRRMELLEHLSLPILDNTTSPRLVSAPESSAFLATDVGKEFFIELTPEDLQACDAKGHNYACSFVFPRFRGGDKSCLAALYMHHTDRARHLCETRPIKEDEKIFRINSTAFMLWTKSPQTINVACGKEDLIAEQVQGLALINLRAGCQAETDSVAFAAQKGRLPDDLHLVVAAPSLTHLEKATETIFRKNEATSGGSLEKEQAALEEELEQTEETRHTTHFFIHKLFAVVSVLGNIALVAMCCFFGSRLMLSCAERGQLRSACSQKEEHDELEDPALVVRQAKEEPNDAAPVSTERAQCKAEPSVAYKKEGDRVVIKLI